MYVGLFDDPSFRWDAGRAQSLDVARAAHVTLVRTLVHWRQVAPVRPGDAADPFDPAYRFDDLDDLVRSAQQRGIEVLMTIWGTPAWANGGAGANVAPSDPGDLTRFSYALADRYSGRHAGFPFVRFFSVWNEPNRATFLAPQFDASGRPAAPAVYARLVRAAYSGVKAASPAALVAAGETASRGHDRPLAGLQDSESPGQFVRLVAEADPALPFDAWAHHPYPPSDAAGPSLGLASVPALEQALDAAFGAGRSVWLTEYAQQTRPEKGTGITYSRQAADLDAAIRAAAADPRVAMFVWFVLRDRPQSPWRSGLLDGGGRAKPAWGRFSVAAFRLDARDPSLDVEPGRVRRLVRVPALELRWHDAPGTTLVATTVVRDGARVVASCWGATTLGRDGWATVTLAFTAVPGSTYVADVSLRDPHGFLVRRSILASAD